MYCNTGCCVHPRCITALEIENGRITLVKWSVLTKPDKTLYVGLPALRHIFGLSKVFLNLVIPSRFLSCHLWHQGREGGPDHRHYKGDVKIL